jgi:hypothetical protein
MEFYTSTWDPAARSSAWLDFLRTRGERSPRADERLWLLDPVPDAVLFVIDSLDDFRRLVVEYPHRWNDRNPTVAPHWRRIAETEPFDAVHATTNAVEAAKAQPATDQPQLRGWDVESTLWLKWRLSLRRCAGHVASGWTVAPG